LINNKLLLSAAIALAASPAAFAQQASTAQDADYGGKRFSVVGGVTLLEPHSDPAEGIDIDGGPAPTLSATWHVDDNWGAALWGVADRFTHRVRGPEGKIGTSEQRPVALSGQDPFGEPVMTCRPFVGLGVDESNISREDLNPGGDHVGLE